MRKNISKIIVWATLIFVAYRLYTSFATTPEKALVDLFTYGVTGDSIGVEISFNNTMEHAYDLADVMNGMIFAGDTIVDMQILEEQYNDSKNLVRVDCLFTVRDTAGEEWTYREYFYMCKSPGMGWEIYNLKSYDDVKSSSAQEDTDTLPQWEEEPQDDIYTGNWYDEYSKRCGMEISCEGGIYYIEINWSSSAWENTRWSFSGTYDEAYGGIICGGKRVEEFYGDDGSMQETVVYEDGVSLLYMSEDGTLYWDDYMQDAGELCYFRKASF